MNRELGIGGPGIVSLLARPEFSAVTQGWILHSVSLNQGG